MLEKYLAQATRGHRELELLPAAGEQADPKQRKQWLDRHDEILKGFGGPLGAAPVARLSGVCFVDRVFDTSTIHGSEQRLLARWRVGPAEPRRRSSPRVQRE